MNIVHSREHRLIPHNQPALTKFGRWEQYTIDSISGILFDGILTGKRGWSITWKRGGMDNRPSISLVSRCGHRSCISDENWKLNRWNAKEEYRNILLDKCYLLYEEYPKEKKTSLYILKPCREIGQSLEESVGGKLVDWTIDMENYADPEAFIHLGLRLGG